MASNIKSKKIKLFPWRIVAEKLINETQLSQSNYRKGERKKNVWSIFHNAISLVESTFSINKYVHLSLPVVKKKVNRIK